VYSGSGAREPSASHPPSSTWACVDRAAMFYPGIYVSWRTSHQNNHVSVFRRAGLQANQWRFRLELDFHPLPSSNFRSVLRCPGLLHILHTAINVQ